MLLLFVLSEGMPILIWRSFDVSKTIILMLILGKVPRETRWIKKLNWLNEPGCLQRHLGACFPFNKREGVETSTYFHEPAAILQVSVHKLHKQ